MNHLLVLIFISCFNLFAMEEKQLSDPVQEVLTNTDLLKLIYLQMFDDITNNAKTNADIANNIRINIKTIAPVCKQFKKALDDLNAISLYAPLMIFDPIPFGLEYAIEMLNSNPQSENPLAKKILLCAHIGTHVALARLNEKVKKLSYEELENALNPGSLAQEASFKGILFPVFRKTNISSSLSKFPARTQAELIPLLQNKLEQESRDKKSANLAVVKEELDEHKKNIISPISSTQHI